jgi:hypothetical protein
MGVTGTQELETTQPGRVEIELELGAADSLTGQILDLQLDPVFTGLKPDLHPIGPLSPGLCRLEAFKPDLSIPDIACHQLLLSKALEIDPISGSKTLGLPNKLELSVGKLVIDLKACPIPFPKATIIIEKIELPSAQDE